MPPSDAHLTIPPVSDFDPVVVDSAGAVRGRGSRRARPIRLTDRDLELLGFVAAHRFVLASQVQAWLGADRAVAYRRLSGLVEAGLLCYRRIFHAQPGCYLVTNGGLAVIDSPLPRAMIDLRCYQHDLGVVLVWLMAREGRFGPVAGLLAEREMRSHDQRFAVPVEGYDRAGKPRVHYPDVLLIRPDGLRVALELELSVKGRRRLEGILVGYSGEPRIAKVLYLTDRRTVASVVSETVVGFGLADRVEVRYFQQPHADLGLGRSRSAGAGEVAG